MLIDGYNICGVDTTVKVDIGMIACYARTVSNVIIYRHHIYGVHFCVSIYVFNRLIEFYNITLGQHASIFIRTPFGNNTCI